VWKSQHWMHESFRTREGFNNQSFRLPFSSPPVVMIFAYYRPKRASVCFDELSSIALLAVQVISQTYSVGVRDGDLQNSVLTCPTSPSRPRKINRHIQA
jgi:hypothetical protein